MHSRTEKLSAQQCITAVDNSKNFEQKSDAIGFLPHQLIALT